MSMNHTEKEVQRQPSSRSLRDLLPGQSRTKEIRSLLPHPTHVIREQDEDTGRYLVYKERGETLAILLKRFRSEQGVSQDVPITYAGRLDPMAEGIVLLLVGNARYLKDDYLKLSKTYEVEVLLGVTTDTQDMLGVITREEYRPLLKERIAQTVEQLINIHELQYPSYSSVIVESKPLFVHARAGNSVLIPSKKVEITEATLLHVRIVALEAIVRDALSDIGKVEGDFRQVQIMKQWQGALQTHKEHIVTIATIRVTASSGTYMRSVATWIGEQLGVPALAYKIKRTKLGDFTL